ncbi:MAG: hypothetical protein QM605_16625 [Sphingobium sp.]
MKARFIDWIWHIRGSLALAPGQSGDEALDRLDPLFRKAGTSHERNHDTLTFRKKDQAAQDKMAVFDGGVLQIERGAGGSVLRYHLTSRILLFCFLAPLLFLSFAGLTVGIGMLEKPSAEATAKKKDEKKEKAELPQHPIDKFLGAPAPEKPKKDDKKKPEEEKSKHSPTPAYVFAAIFAILYVVGRILEERLVRALFKKKLFGQ